MKVIITVGGTAGTIRAVQLLLPLQILLDVVRSNGRSSLYFLVAVLGPFLQLFQVTRLFGSRAFTKHIFFAGLERLPVGSDHSSKLSK